MEHQTASFDVLGNSFHVERLDTQMRQSLRITRSRLHASPTCFHAPGNTLAREAAAQYQDGQDGNTCSIPASYNPSAVRPPI